MQRRVEEPELWEHHEENIRRFLQEKLGLQLEDEEVMSMVGKMLTNFGELEVRVDQGKGCGYYPTYANMNHACR